MSEKPTNRDEHNNVAVTTEALRRAVSRVMPEQIAYPQVTSATLSELVARLRTAGNPERIVLFGSRARGDAHAASDLDILIVEESELPRYRRAPRYLRALVGLFPANDVVVWTPAEIEEWQAVPNAFITTALREGKVLYERPR